MLLPILAFLPILISFTLALPPLAPSQPFSVPSTLALNTTNDEAGLWQCTTDPDWFDLKPGASYFQISDCEWAVRELLADVADFGSEDYEWLSWGTPFHRRTGGPREGKGTPKKYVYKTCTLTLAFLRDLPPWPGKPPIPYPSKYTTTYLSMYQHAKALHDECLAGQGKLGWFGPRSGLVYPIGIFFWQTRSAEDERTPGTDAGIGETR